MTLQPYPNALRELGKSIAGLDHTIRVYREEMRLKEASITREVIAEARHTNDLARRAEIALRLEEATPEIRGRLLRAEFDRATKQAELDAVRAEFRIWQLNQLEKVTEAETLPREFFQNGGVV
jgi:hypothetical protein